MAIIKIKNQAIDLDAAEIPNLPATKITSGTFDNARISLDAAEIPNLDTAKITTGTLADARVPNLNASKITAGTITDARLPANALNSNVSVPNQSAFKNIIINGDMSLAQRGTSTSSITADGFYSCDRWKLGIGSFGTWTQSQDSDVPSGYGFSKSLKMDCTTAQGSPGVSNAITYDYSVEGQNLQYLKWGTSSAEQVTLSFWHKHTKTGTNIVELLDSDNGDAVSGSYTQSVSNTWEKATIVYPAKTSGALDNDNARSLRIRITIGAGSNYTSGTLATTWQSSITNANRLAGQVNNADSTSNNFIIAGVQFEAGTSASDFEFLPVDVNLGRCQRYFYMHGQGAGDELGIGCYYNSSQIALDFAFPVTMRATPSVYQTTGTNYFATYRPGVVDGFNSLTAGSATTTMFGLYNNTEVSGTAQDAQFFRTANGSAKLGADAEL